MQDLVHQTFQRFGRLWSRQEILLKSSEELGELIRAFRKEELKEQKHEFGDVLFSLYALAEREGFNVNDLLHGAIVRFEKYCNQLAANTVSAIQELDRERIAAGGYAHSDAFEQPSVSHSESKISNSTVRQLTDSYPNYCRVCSRVPVHKSNTLRVCPDCISETVDRE